jgi:hypothetical protein
VVGVDADASVATLISARDDAGGLGPIDLPLGRRGRRVRRAGEFADPTRLVGVRCKDRQQATLGGRSQDRREGECFGTHGGPLRGDCFLDWNTCAGKATFVNLSHHCEPWHQHQGCLCQRIPDGVSRQPIHLGASRQLRPMDLDCAGPAGRRRLRADVVSVAAPAVAGQPSVGTALGCAPLPWQSRSRQAHTGSSSSHAAHASAYSAVRSSIVGHPPPTPTRTRLRWRAAAGVPASIGRAARAHAERGLSEGVVEQGDAIRPDDPGHGVARVGPSTRATVFVCAYSP